MLRAGSKAPSFILADMDTGAPVADPWSDGRTVLAFFKTTCPVCVMTAPKVAALSRGGARLVAIGEDPPDRLRTFASANDQRVLTLSEPPPYEVSSAFGLSSVPSLIVVSESGEVEAAVGGWDRDAWNAIAESFGSAPVSEEGDGLPVFRPG